MNRWNEIIIAYLSYLRLLRSSQFRTCAKVSRKANNDRFGGRQNFFPDSWQQTFGKQSNVLLHGSGCKSNAGGGAGVHCKYPDNASIANDQIWIDQHNIIYSSYRLYPYTGIISNSNNDDYSRMANCFPTGKLSNSGLEVRQYLFNPSGQQIRGQQSWSVLHVFNSQNSSASGSFGHLRGIRPRIAI